MFKGGVRFPSEEQIKTNNNFKKWSTPLKKLQNDYDINNFLQRQKLLL